MYSFLYFLLTVYAIVKKNVNQSLKCTPFINSF